MFITLEGIDGCGKSTQVKRLVEYLHTKKVSVVSLREPGGTTISEAIRQLVLDPQHREMCDECELLLYEAARAQLTNQVIIPALKEHKTVICDRYYDSTFAYQYGARGLQKAIVQTANHLGSCGISPDLTLVMDIDVDVAFARVQRRASDRMEQEGMIFQQKVQAAYRELAEMEPARVKLIDAMGSEGEVFSRIQHILNSYTA